METTCLQRGSVAVDRACSTPPEVGLDNSGLRKPPLVYFTAVHSCPRRRRCCTTTSSGQPCKRRTTRLPLIWTEPDACDAGFIEAGTQGREAQPDRMNMPSAIGVHFAWLSHLVLILFGEWQRCEPKSEPPGIHRGLTEEVVICGQTMGDGIAEVRAFLLGQQGL
jgi:hypothetical protein